MIICGGISAYKCLEIIRGLKKSNAQIKTILTKSAKEFVTPLSISSLSQEKVYEDIFSIENESEMDHISLSRWADLILVAPATANTISKLSYGSADDLASTVILASNKDIYLVPAMNVRMWEHPSTKENLNKLKNYGYKIIGPEIGDMACGEFGKGKMTEPNEIIKEINSYFEVNEKNKKYKAIVTAGPTREFIDPVRFITNNSSGKQGYEIARSLAKFGVDTTLISGPSKLKKPENVNIVRVETAEQMFEETKRVLPVDIAVCAAAVSDFKPEKYEKNKIKKDTINLNLKRNIDILEFLSKNNQQRPKLVVGFAAETENISEFAKKKIHTKYCDWIVANDVSNPEIGFGSDYNEVAIISKSGEAIKLEKNAKSFIANYIVKKIINHFVQ